MCARDIRGEGLTSSTAVGAKEAVEFVKQAQRKRRLTEHVAVLVDHGVGEKARMAGDEKVAKEEVRFSNRVILYKEFEVGAMRAYRFYGTGAKGELVKWSGECPEYGKATEVEVNAAPAWAERAVRCVEPTVIRANKRKASEKAEKEIIAKVEGSKVAMKGASENKLTLGEARGHLFSLFAEEYGIRNTRLGTDPQPGVRGLTH